VLLLWEIRELKRQMWAENWRALAAWLVCLFDEKALLTEVSPVERLVWES
jgi:hypothetical protein